MRLTVRKKLVFAFSVLIILMGVLGAFSISSIILVDKKIDDLYERDLKGIEHIKTAEANLIAISRARNNMILSTEGAERARHAENMKLLFQKFEKSLEDFNGTIVGEEARQRLDEILKIWEQLKPNEEKVIDLAINSTIEESHAQVMKNRAITDQIESEMNTLVNIKNEQASKAIKESDLAYVKIRNIIMIIITLSILIGIGIAFYMSNTIAKPIARMSEVASKIADGDLSIQEIKVRTNDEIGELGKSFNTMTESLRAVIKQVLDASEQVAASSEELSASSEEITSATEEVAAAINQLAIGASKQAEDASKVSMGVNEIASGIDEVAKNANSVSITSVNVSKEATNGFNEAKIAVEKVERIKQVTEESAKGVRILGDESVKIGQIVEVIKDIADQTNLLALNAAIEAARAGEQGRGFAVVADEVSKLAEQSSVSALQIGELIGNVQSETKRVIDAMDVTTQEVLDGVVAVNKTGKYFELIFNEINDVTNQIQEVNIASQKIAGGSQYLDESIESIAAIAEETAASSEEVSASSEEQTSAMEEISDAAHELSRLAEELQVNVSRFKI